MSYQEDRDALIPLAIKEANERLEIFKRNNKGKYIVGKSGKVLVSKPGTGVNWSGEPRKYMHDMLTEYFMSAMDRLAREKGLVR